MHQIKWKPLIICLLIPLAVGRPVRAADYGKHGCLRKPEPASAIAAGIPFPNCLDHPVYPDGDFLISDFCFR